VVLGHANCGGIRAFSGNANGNASPLSPGDFIGKWMSLIAPAAERVKPSGNDEEDLRQLELAAIELSLRNLLTFPCVSILVERGALQLHGAYFGVNDGVMLVRDPATGAFKRLVEGAHPSSVTA
jgi:carbonic anhydrase